MSGYCARSVRLNPPPSCCIANKILMSPLPLPLGRLLRSARGAGSSASRAGRGSPVRSRPRLRGLGLAGCRPGPASSSPGRPSSASFPAFSRASGRVGEGRPRAASWSLRPSTLQDLAWWGRRSSRGLELPLGHPACFLPSSFLLPCSLSGHRRGFPSHCPQFIASPLPSPSPGLRPGYFLTFYNLL